MAAAGNNAQWNLAEGWELDVIAAVVIGGVRLTGGQGSVIGAALGAVIIVLMRNALFLSGVPTGALRAHYRNCHRVRRAGGAGSPSANGGAGGVKLGRRLPAETSAIVVFAAAVTWLSIQLPISGTQANALAILSSASEIAIVAAAMTLVIATGGIDISVGSIIGLSGVTIGILAAEKGWGIAPACIAGLAVD